MGHFAFRATEPGSAAAARGDHRAGGHRARGGPTATSGHGPAYAFTTSDGHNMEIYYETEWYKAPPELKPSLKNQAMRFPAAARTCAGSIT